MNAEESGPVGGVVRRENKRGIGGYALVGQRRANA
jgi:hypothetical protein